MTHRDTSTTERDNLRMRANAAVLRFLDRTGHVILEAPFASEEKGVDVITEHEGTLRFIDVRLAPEAQDWSRQPASEQDIERFVRTAAAWAARTQCVEGELGYDILTVIVCGDQRAVVEYHRGAHLRP